MGLCAKKNKLFLNYKKSKYEHFNEFLLPLGVKFHLDGFICCQNQINQSILDAVV